MQVAVRFFFFFLVSIYINGGVRVFLGPVV